MSEEELREKVYREVWSRPVAHVAKERGSSDRAFAKWCKRRAIPVPSSAYWSKARAGLPVEVPPLPPPPPKPDPEERRERVRQLWAEKRRQAEEREAAERLPRARRALHDAIDAIVGVVATTDRTHRDVHRVVDEVLDAVREYLRAAERPELPSGVSRAAHRAVDRVLNTVKKELSDMAKKKPVISPKVASALHAALQTVIDAINEPDTTKPKRRRGPAMPAPLPMPDLPPEKLKELEAQLHQQLRRAGYRVP